MQEFVTKTIDLHSGTSENKRREIREYFEKTWALDEKLYTQLKLDEIFYHRGDPLRHILLFYLGHTAVFFINKLYLAKIIDTRINPALESIFAIGVDEMSWDDLNEKNYDWPTVCDVRLYRDKAKLIILDVIDNLPLTVPVDWENPFWLIMMGIEHERIHLETSSVLIRQLPLDEIIAGRFGEICKERGIAPQNLMLHVSGAEMVMGKSPNHSLYGWDNEFGKLTLKVEDFNTSKMVISNGEFFEFVNQKGYSHNEFWTEEGWNWRNFKQAEMPLFWRKTDDKYYLRLVDQEIEMPWNWPVEVNYLEAKAFCNWKTAQEGKAFRLPTEAEWIRLTEVCAISDQLEWETAPGNINLEHFASPCPVDKFKMGDFFDVIGNVWQWTETPITGYPGFKVHPMYDDFSMPTFDGKHNLIKGGSWISTGNEATQHARYAFRRHFYQHAGFRVVQSESPLIIENNEYETDMEVANSCENMWGDASYPNFWKLLADKILQVTPNMGEMKLLDLNADTGRLAFELAPFFKQITAIDFSARYIHLPIQLQKQGFIRYIVQDEGELVFYREVELSKTALGQGKEKITFMQDNANNLKPIYKDYDMIVAPNILEELNCPILFLQKINSRLNENGYLIITSNYDWQKNNISPELCPGGFKRDGEPVSSLDGIKAILKKWFTLEKEPFSLPMTLRKTSRLTEQHLCEVTVWRKK
ncbi:MAG: 5-histidylcysteine sulfoxide synthase [Paludibacter sp.]|nr:5-histidylcysteine sulfoxide synthase [Paludibacter sp.]